jgi:hypothetical protein
LGCGATASGSDTAPWRGAIKASIAGALALLMFTEGSGTIWFARGLAGPVAD